MPDTPANASSALPDPLTLPDLHPYQEEVFQAILHSIATGAGHTFTVMFARQMGKNELSARLEAFLLHHFQTRGGTIVKCAPTFHPQIINSRLRLLQTLEHFASSTPASARPKTAHGYIVSLGRARVMFLSAGPQAHVVGATANLLLEVDEAQDINEDKFYKEFRPMAATSNATTVLYGTAWTRDTLLARQSAINIELERRDHVRRHFQYDWSYLAQINPAYARFVQNEIERLGPEHPAIRTQYLLEPIDSATSFFSPSHLAQLQGNHPPEEAPATGPYIAGLDIAGEDEQPTDRASRLANPHRDSTVLTIGRLVEAPLAGTWRVEVVHHQWWTGRDHQTQYLALLDLIRTWDICRIAVDATGIGEALASFLRARLGDSVVEAYKFTRPTKSHLAYNLLSMVNTGRIKLHTRTSEAVDREAWRQYRSAKHTVLPGGFMNFYVDPSDGHDDFLLSLALLAHAASQSTPLSDPAQAVIRPRILYPDENRYGF
jgi:hypothetical protein